MRTQASDIAFEPRFHNDVARAPCGRAARACGGVHPNGFFPCTPLDE